MGPQGLGKTSRVSSTQVRVCQHGPSVPGLGSSGAGSEGVGDHSQAASSLNGLEGVGLRPDTTHRGSWVLWPSPDMVCGAADALSRSRRAPPISPPFCPAFQDSAWGVLAGVGEGICFWPRAGPGHKGICYCHCCGHAWLVTGVLAMATYRWVFSPSFCRPVLWPLSVEHRAEALPSEPQAPEVGRAGAGLSCSPWDGSVQIGACLLLSKH